MWNGSGALETLANTSHLGLQQDGAVAPRAVELEGAGVGGAAGEEPFRAPVPTGDIPKPHSRMLQQK